MWNAWRRSATFALLAAGACDGEVDALPISTDPIVVTMVAEGPKGTNGSLVAPIGAQDDAPWGEVELVPGTVALGETVDVVVRLAEGLAPRVTRVDARARFLEVDDVEVDIVTRAYPFVRDAVADDTWRLTFDVASRPDEHQEASCWQAALDLRVFAAPRSEDDEDGGSTEIELTNEGCAETSTAVADFEDGCVPRTCVPEH